MAEKFAGTAYDTDVADIGEGATYLTASGEMYIGNTGRITLMPYATGAHASSSGTVTINLLASLGGKWSTVTWQSITVAVSGTSEDVSAPIELDALGIRAIKVGSIVNGDATYHITNVNVQFASPQRF